MINYKLFNACLIYDVEIFELGVLYSLSVPKNGGEHNTPNSNSPIGYKTRVRITYSNFYKFIK